MQVGWSVPSDARQPLLCHHVKSLFSSMDYFHKSTAIRIIRVATDETNLPFFIAIWLWCKAKTSNVKSGETPALPTRKMAIARGRHFDHVDPMSRNVQIVFL